MRFNQQDVLADFSTSLNTLTANLTTDWEESSSIEFKKSLHTKSETIDKEYLKTISGFANCGGGVIVFGIEPTSKELIGIKEEYENLDNRYISSTVRLSLDGQISYIFFTNRYLGKLIGFLVIQESQSKPVILKVDAGDAKRGEIYFRYPAQTALIGAGELRKIILDEITNNVKATLENFKNIIESGNENIALLNTRTGEIQSNQPNLKLTLNSDILDKLNLIKTGELVSQDGAPAYIIRGHIDVENNSYREKEVPTLLPENQITKMFISGECEYPEVAIKQVLHFRTEYNPIHFFIRKKGLTVSEGITFINEINDSALIETTRSKILERLGEYSYPSNGTLYGEFFDNIDFSVSIDDNITKMMLAENVTNKKYKQQVLRKLFLNTLLNHVVIDKIIIQEHTQKILEALSHITKEQLQSNTVYYLNKLNRISDIEMEATAKMIFRKIVCKFDDWLYRE